MVMTIALQISKSWEIIFYNHLTASSYALSCSITWMISLRYKLRVSYIYEYFKSPLWLSNRRGNSDKHVFTCLFNDPSVLQFSTVLAMHERTQ